MAKNAAKTETVVDEVPVEDPVAAAAPEKVRIEGKPRHQATYARDKFNGGWNVRVGGPNANRFAGKIVPVRLYDGEEHEEHLLELIRSGPDEDGGLWALYKFQQRARASDIAF